MISLSLLEPIWTGFKTQNILCTLLINLWKLHIQYNYLFLQHNGLNVDGLYSETSKAGGKSKAPPVNNNVLAGFGAGKPIEAVMEFVYFIIGCWLLVQPLLIALFGLLPKRKKNVEE